DVVVGVNSLGFRGPECTREKGPRRRIAAIGDSFTLGWGVNFEDAWTTRLGNALNESGQSVELLNLGQGGAYPRVYADIARRAVPMLKPDLVLVAILEGDDLQQTVSWHDRNLPGRRPAPRPEPSILDSAKSFVRNRLFRNFFDSATPLASSVKDVWRPQAA